MSLYSNHCPDTVAEVHNRVGDEEGYPGPAPVQWPADWSETDALYFERWSIALDQQVRPPEPEDIEPGDGGACLPNDLPNDLSW
jgi:hypothetical protein